MKIYIQSSNGGRPHSSGWNSSSEWSTLSAIKEQSASLWGGTATTFILAALAAFTPTLLKCVDQNELCNNKYNYYRSHLVSRITNQVVEKGSHAILGSTWCVKNYDLNGTTSQDKQTST